MNTKPNILVFPFDLLSHYTRSLSFVQIYSESHNVLFKASSNYNEIIHAEGLATFPCEDFDPDHVINCVKKFCFDWLNVADVERIFLDQVKCILQFKPDFVIGDTSPTLKMAAEYTNTKVVTLINGYMSKYYQYQRPMPSSHPAAFIQKVIPSYFFMKVLSVMEHKAFISIHKPLNEIRKKYQLKHMEYYLDELEGDQTFVCDAAEVFPQQTLPENYRVTGPLFYSSRNKSPVAFSRADPHKENVLVSFGSSGEWRHAEWLNDASFAKYNVFTAGDEKNIINGAHVYPMTFVDFNLILPQMQLLICHGGNGTLNLTYKHHVPFIAFPSMMEQEWNALRFQELGLGLTFTKKKTSSEMHVLIDKLLRHKN